MSRSLPVRPNLEHLKHQARSRLSELRRLDPDVRLSDALHATAREYGFSTWHALKEHVEAARAAGAADRESPFAGLWTANLENSPEPLLRLCNAATLEFAVEADRVTMSDTVREPSGAETKHSYTLRVGGPPQQVDHGYVMVADWRGPRRLEVSVAHDGHHLMRVSYAVSDDGRTLTVSAVAAAHAGYPAVEQATLFDRADR
jgi:hypothetical protein